MNRLHNHKPARFIVTTIILLMLWRAEPPVLAEQPVSGDSAAGQAASPPSPVWHYGGFLDLAYLLNFNFPANHRWRNRTTTPRVNELDLNMAGVYVRKDATELSRWGTEWLIHGGQDAKEFAFAADAPKVGASDQLRHFGRANVSYRAPLGKGLLIQAGLFNSLIGYDSLYAKDNINYTRPWGGDYTPYLMFGINAAYPLTEQLTGTLFVINGYAHLAHPNNSPSYGGQLAYQPSSNWTVKETLYYGPDQANTSPEFWRFFSDTITEWRGEKVLLAFEYQIGTETIAVSGSPRAFWTAALLPIRWNIAGPWSVAIRPEFYWDRNGRMTGSEQFIKAFTTTLEYRVLYQWTTTILRLEHRFDESRGVGGGFFKDTEIQPGIVALTPTQHMLVFSAIWAFDSP